MAASHTLTAISISGITGSFPQVAKIEIYVLNTMSEYYIVTSQNITDNNPNISLTGSWGVDYAPGTYKVVLYDGDNNVIASKEGIQGS